ncbi:MAG: BMP family ABC transporter substrate-binding protein [Spirochaetales bacterium]|nr:BMP family ABC transporter substrate-binding protein [Spirochaetales bacterium]
MKKALLLLVALSFTLFSLSANGGKETKEEKKAAPAAPKLIAAMATDVGGLGDGSFNDGSYAGLTKAQADGICEARVVESKQMTDYIPNLTGLAEDGADIVFAVGFLMADAIIEAAQNNPETKYAGIDIWVDPATAPTNVLGISFNEHEAGYLAGIVAGYMTKEYAGKSDRLNDDNVIGVVLGMDIPPCERYEVGFQAGAQSVNPDVKVLQAVAGDFADQAKGKELTLAMINEGADIVFQVAGLTGMGVIAAAQEEGTLAIGVDVDQYAAAPEAVLTSAMKGITEAAYQTIQSVADGSFKGATNVSLGIKENAVGIAPYHNFDSVIPQEVKDAVNKAVADIQSGKITVPASRAEL